MRRLFIVFIVAALSGALSPAFAAERCADEVENLEKRIDALHKRLGRLARCERERRVIALFREAAVLNERCLPGLAGSRLAAQYRGYAREATKRANAPPDGCGLSR